MNNNDDVATIDFETYSECNIMKCGSYKYSMHPSTKILLLSIKMNDQPSVVFDICNGDVLPDYFIKHIKDGKRVIAHNEAFEWAIWKNVCVRKLNWPIIRDDQWFDTLAQCGMHALPLSLDKSTEVLKLTNKKNDIGKSLLNIFSVPQKDGRRITSHQRPSDWEMFKVYNRDDTDATYELYSTLLKPKEHEYKINMQLTRQMNATGIPVDVESAKVIFEKINIEKETYTERISKLTNGVITKVTQTARMKKWIMDHYDIDMPNFQAETVERWLERTDLPDDVYDLLEMRNTGGKSSNAKFERLIDMATEDGRIHSVFIHHLTTTGRVGGRGFQPTNMAKPSVKYESMDQLIDDLVIMSNEEINAKYGSFMKAASSSLRGHIKAPPGMQLFGADYAAIEARIVFWLAGCQRGLMNYHNGIDMYKDAATIVYGVKYNSVTDDQRWLGKQIILGCGYGLAWKGFQNSCAQYNVNVPEDVCRLAVESYRETYFEVPELWESMNKAAMMAMSTGKECFAAKGKISFKLLKLKNGQLFLFMKLPSSRLIAYPQVNIEIVTTPWGKKQKAITFRKLVNNFWGKESTYGGKLTENAVQAIARDIMYAGAQNVVNASFKPILQIYDELISIAPESFMELETYEHLLCNPMPEWAKGIPLKAEGKILSRYQKL